MNRRTARIESQATPQPHFQGIRFGFSSVRFDEYREGKLSNSFALRGIVTGIFRSKIENSIKHHIGNSSGGRERKVRRLDNTLEFLGLLGQEAGVPCIFSPLLYRLSYLGIGMEARIK